MTVVWSGTIAAAAEHPPVKSLAKADCGGCHDPVVSHRMLHKPVASGDCAACHTVDETPGRRRIALKNGAAKGDTTALCVSCHQENGERLKQAHRHAPVAAGQCTACHNPHGSDYPFQLADERNRTCVRCHEDIGKALAQSHPHAPAAAACSICHDAHAAAHPAQMQATANVVCLTCHLENGARRLDTDTRTLFGRVPIDGLDQLVATAPHIALDQSLRGGHPTIGHPVDGRSDPGEPARPLRCTSCHNPHGTGKGKLLRFGAAGTSPLCIRCHSF
ncbi:MAG TPA: cytochrome c3 family protein [Vicinamibacterales bacterium]|nr:cytochrome c3 family protein [Vicinamibacterales bacterium]